MVDKILSTVLADKKIHVPERFFALVHKKIVILCVYLHMVKEITNLQSRYAYKKFKTVCKGKNLRTQSYVYMRTC
jgi:hypothetical protein